MENTVIQHTFLKLDQSKKKQIFNKNLRTPKKTPDLVKKTVAATLVKTTLTSNWQWKAFPFNRVGVCHKRCTARKRQSVLHGACLSFYSQCCNVCSFQRVMREERFWTTQVVYLCRLGLLQTSTATRPVATGAFRGQCQWRN